MTVLAEQGQCVHCGGALPGRTDPRGRRARYCCGACRAAASRARVAAQAAATSLGGDRVVGAVEALAVVAETRPLTPQEFDRARRIVDAAARISEVHRARTTPPARAGLAAASSTPQVAATGLSRQQRRARDRAARKAGG